MAYQDLLSQRAINYRRRLNFLCHVLCHVTLSLRFSMAFAVRTTRAVLA